MSRFLRLAASGFSLLTFARSLAADCSPQALSSSRRLNSVITASTTCVFGHKIPDTDAICSAIVRARELELDGEVAVPFRLGDLNPETTFVLQHLGVEVPALLPELKASSCPSVAVVDTNNPNELPDDMGSANLTSVVDHHKLAGFVTTVPIEMDIRPVCSTGTILYHRFRAKGYPIDPDTASLMLAAILSDSLHFRSVTTTPVDVEAARQLAVIADIDADAFASAMLEAKSQTSHLTAEQLVLMDSKVYKIHGEQTRISVVETTHSPNVLARSQEIMAAVENLKHTEELDRLLFFVVDIIAEQAIFITKDQTEAARISDAFTKFGVQASVNETAKEFHVTLRDVLSRKKQIIPALEA